MAKTTLGVVVRHVRQLVGCQNTSEDADHELLRRYTVGRDETAFAALVQRHGPMVWNVCRRAVSHHQDAEDVFQATFLVLARKASAIRWRASIVPWLYAVAQRLAAKARVEAATRPVTAVVEPAAPDLFQAITARELLTALDEEVAGLPEHYRGPLVLCWLQGQSQEETARQLGTSLSTLRRRLDGAKRLLNLRLTRRGLAPATLGSLTLASAPASACPAFAPATPRAVALAQTLLTTMTVKFKFVVAVLLLAGTLALATGLAWAALAPAPSPAPMVQHKEPPPPAEVVKAKEPCDLLGDPLPAGALFRLGSVRLRHSEALYALAYSPAADLLASGGWDQKIRLWDANTGKELRTIQGPKKGVGALTFSPDGQWLAGAGDDKNIYLWDPATGKELRQLDRQGQGVTITGLVFSAKGNLLVVASQTSLQFWDVAAGKLLRSLDVKIDHAAAVVCSPGGRIVAAPGNDRAVHLWDTGSGKLLHKLAGHTDRATTVVFAQDGKTVITTDVDHIWLWDTASGKKLNANNAMKSRHTAFAALSPDGKLLAVGGEDGVIRLWDWAAGKQLSQLPRLADRVRRLAFSRDGKTLAALADAVHIHLWDVATGKPKLALPGHQERLTSVVWAPGGNMVVTAAWDGTVRLWNAQAGKEIRQLDNDLKSDSDALLNPAALGQVAVSPDGKQVAAVRGDEVALVWDVGSGKVVHRFKAQCVAFSPDGKLIALGGRGTQNNEVNKGVIRLVDRATGKVLRELRGHLTQIGSVAFTPDSKTLISRGMVLFGARFGDPGENETKFVRFWDVATGKERKAVSAGSRLSGVILSPDGRTVAELAFLQAPVTLWETVTGQQRGELVGHTDMIFDAAFAPDGRVLATASMDGTVRLWDLSSCKEIGCLAGHRGWVLSVAFSPDGTKLVSGSLDTTALIWDVSRFTKRGPVVALTAAELEACYVDLSGSAAAAYRAVGRLTASPKQAVALLRERLRPAPQADAQAIAKLIADLDSKQFQTRDQAAKELEKLGRVAAPALDKALAAVGTLEMRRRLELLLEKLDGVKLPPDMLRQLRAVEVLESIGGGEAKELLHGLVAAGASEALLTHEAQAALRRLK